MNEPEATIRNARSLGAELLDSARADAPPPELLGRTLARVGIAAAGAVAASTAASSASATAASATATGGGLFGAIGIGVLAGLLTVGIADQVWIPAAAPPAAPAVAPSTPRKAPAALRATSAPPSTPPELTPDSSPPASPPRAPSAAAPSPPRASASTLAAELALIDAARSALAAGDSARALAVLDRHAREFPAGQLTHEAGVLRTEATTGIATAPSIP